MEGAPAPQEGSTASSSENSSSFESSEPSPNQPIELEIDGVKQQFQPQQILNLIQNYERLQSDAQEYQASQTQMNNLLANLQENPSLLWDFAESLGHDPRELTKSKFKEYLEYEQMTPEQKRVYELERQLKGYKEQQELEEEFYKKQAYEQKVDETYNQIKNEFEEFYANNPKIKPNRFFAQDIVNIQRIGLEQTGRRPSVQEAFEIYKHKETYYKKNIWNSISEDDIPDELLKLARKKLAKQTQNFRPPHLKNQKGVTRKKSGRDTKKGRSSSLTIQDFFGS